MQKDSQAATLSLQKECYPTTAVWKLSKKQLQGLARGCPCPPDRSLRTSFIGFIFPSGSALHKFQDNITHIHGMLGNLEAPVAGRCHLTIGKCAAGNIWWQLAMQQNKSTIEILYDRGERIRACVSGQVDPVVLPHVTRRPGTWGPVSSGHSAYSSGSSTQKPSVSPLFNC